MKVEILEIRKFKGLNSEEFSNYQIALAGRKVWVSQLEFSNYSDLIIVEDDIITLKEPIKDYYEIVNKENKRGKFTTLIPKTKLDSIKKGRVSKLLEELGAEPNKLITDKDLINEIMEEETSRKADLENEKQIVSDFEVLYEIIDEVKTSQQITDEVFINEVVSKVEIPKERKFNFKGTSIPQTPEPENFSKKNQVPVSSPKDAVISTPKNTKVMFINEMLRMGNRKDVSEKIRERVIDLVSKEAVGNDEVLKEIQKDVSEIKKYINKTPPSNTKQPDLHNPKILVEYLYKFSSDENLKWLTHEKETDFDYALILEEAKKTFESFKKTLIPMHTYFNIQNFIIGNKDKKFPSLKLYGNKNIYLDWSTEEVLEWCKENPGVYPNDMPIPKEKQYPIANNKNFMLLKFGDVIKEFKHYIEIRTDDEQRTLDLRLSDLMRRLGLYTDFNKPEFNELFKSVNVYTDTNLLFQGFEQIFNWCFDHRAKSNRIDISIESENEFYTLKIKHIGSKIGYEKDSSKLNGLGGDLNKVRKWFFNICDWEIHAKLSDGKSYRIELLNSNVNTLEKNSLITEIEPVDGVIHIVKLYKTVNL